jgi:hypothetical protein
MRKYIISTFILIIIIISILSFIFINYKSDVEAINDINISLNNVNIFDLKITSFKLNLDVEIINPSNREINQLSSYFDIYIENNYIGNGNFSNVNIQKNSNISKTIIITIYYSGLADAAVDIIENLINEGEFDLRINGTIYANALFGMSIIEQTFIATKTYP